MRAEMFTESIEKLLLADAAKRFLILLNKSEYFALSGKCEKLKVRLRLQTPVAL